MFLGRFDHTIDAKGRISVPAHFRDALLGDQRLVLAPYTIYGERCLDVYPHGEWQKLLERFAVLPQFSAKTVKFQIGYLARSHPCEIDGPGRILLPPLLRQYAGLKKDVVFLGTHTMFRLMDRESWVKVEGEHDAEAAEDRAIYEDLGI